MNNHIQITFWSLQPGQQEILIAHLAEAGYEGFEEVECELRAFIPQKTYERERVAELAAHYQLSFTEEVIVPRNWNEVWESSFEPVVVDDFLAIRADFHAPVQQVKQEIIITPKMSFGTGHHATTYLMVQEMQHIDFAGKMVLDFGTGTGILSILASKLGAEAVKAIDNDDWSIANARENIQHNHCNNITLQRSEDIGGGPYHIIMANINKNVILGNLAPLSGQLFPGGILLISGLLEEDRSDMLLEAGKFSLVFKGISTKGNWICLRFTH